jgi:hypothetical protein
MRWKIEAVMLPNAWLRMSSALVTMRLQVWIDGLALCHTDVLVAIDEGGLGVGADLVSVLEHKQLC